MLRLLRFWPYHFFTIPDFLNFSVYHYPVLSMPCNIAYLSERKARNDRAPLKRGGRSSFKILLSDDINCIKKIDTL